MKKRVSASLTVEATFVFPVVFFLIFSIICLTFYLHDKCRLQYVVDKALHKASLSLKHEADLVSGQVEYEKINDRGVFYLSLGNTEKEKGILEGYLQQELTEGFLFTKVRDIRVVVEKREIEILAEGEFNIPLGLVMNFFHPKPIRIQVNRPIHNPAEFIRMGEVILDTGEKIKGVEVLKEKIKQFSN